MAAQLRGSIGQWNVTVEVWFTGSRESRSLDRGSTAENVYISRGVAKFTSFGVVVQREDSVLFARLGHGQRTNVPEY
jgi:hypothetical protein